MKVSVVFILFLVVLFLVVAHTCGAEQVCIDCGEGDMTICFKIGTKIYPVPAYYYTDYDFRSEPEPPYMPEVTIRPIYRGRHGHMEEISVSIPCRSAGAIVRIFLQEVKVYPTATSHTGYMQLESVKLVAVSGVNSNQSRFNDADGNGYVDIRDMAAQLAPSVPCLASRGRLVGTWGGIKSGRW